MVEHIHISLFAFNIDLGPKRGHDISFISLVFVLLKKIAKMLSHLGFVSISAWNMNFSLYVLGFMVKSYLYQRKFKNGAFLL